MGCITSNIASTGGCLSARISRVGNTLNANIGLADEHLVATISRIGGNLKANVGIICTPNTNTYLFVTPTDIDIPQDGLPVFVNVESNAVWVISPVIKWDEGDGNIIVISNGKGNEIISISSDANEGIDREQQIIIQTLDNKNEVTILAKQIGLREVYNVLEGEYILSNGETYNVLK